MERPIFIIGMPRTGTTLLSHLLAQDPQLRSLMGWEARSSVPPPEAATFGSDPRIAAAEQSGRLLDALLDVFPDASFVVTHRDPVKVVASTCSLVHALSGTFSDADHRAYIARHWTAVLDDMVRRVEEHRNRDAGRFLDLDYAAWVADPIGAVRRVHRHVGAELTPAVEAAMARYLAGNPAGKHGRHGYALADLGLDRGELEERFSAYVERYDIAREPVA